MAELWIANTVTDLIQGDVREHLPLERIPLQGDVLGLGTTTSLDNGELTCLQQQQGGDTTIWKCEASSGGIRALQPGDGSGHFPYVCFSGDAMAVRTPVDPAALGPMAGRPLQELVAEAIAQLRQAGRLPEAPIYGLASDLGVEQLRFAAGVAAFRVANRGSLDVSDVGVAVVIDDRYSDHRYLRLPWLAAGAVEEFSLPLALEPGRHRLEVIADPEREILERPELQANNRQVLEVEV